MEGQGSSPSAPLQLVPKEEVAVEEERKEGGEIESAHSQYQRSRLPELLRVYYARLFPYDKYHEWLQYGT